MLSVLGSVAVLASVVNALNLTVSSTGGNATSALQYGIMFEDINHSGDGGIYAELIQNRAFQGSSLYPSVIDPWTAVGAVSLSLSESTTPLSEALPTSLRVSLNDSTQWRGERIGIKNPGWWGIDVKEQQYTGSFWSMGAYNGKFVASLESSLTDDVWATAEINGNGEDGKWREYEFCLTPKVAAPNVNNTFSLTFTPETGGLGLEFGLISLFPPTYKNRKNGMRKDLMEALKALNPSFLRMPGGNNIEGNSPPYMWHWNETIGPLIDRPGRPGTWGYQNTDGLGLVEYLFWCQDLEIEPVLAVWAGLYLNGVVTANATLQGYVQDTLDELEFIMGDVSTHYGALRAKLGYPEPWVVKYIEIGNEDNLNSGSSSYSSYRFISYYNAIIAKYPNMNVLSSTVALTTSALSATPLSGLDYHQYTRPNYFVSQFNFFDHYSTVHKTLIGEYASIQPNQINRLGADWTAPKNPWSEWIGTIAESIFLIGAERNTDHIIGSCYAPLFQNLNSFQWTPDLISFTADPSENVLSTSYHQVKLFSNTRMTTVLPTTSLEATAFGPAYFVAGINDASSQYILKAAIYNSTQPVPFNLTLPGQTKAAKLTVLTATSPFSVNSPNNTNQVIETITDLVLSEEGTWEWELENWSVALLVVDV